MAIFARGCTLWVVLMSHCCTSYPQQCPRLKSRGRKSSNTDAVHLAFAKRVRHTTRTMEVLPGDFASVVCEVCRAWRVIGDSFAAAG